MLGRESNLSPTTTRQTTQLGLSVTIPFSLLEHTLFSRGSAIIAPTDFSLLVPNGDSIEQNESAPLIAEDMDDTEGEAVDIFSRVRKRRKRKKTRDRPVEDHPTSFWYDSKGVGYTKGFTEYYSTSGPSWQDYCSWPAPKGEFTPTQDWFHFN